MNTSGFSIENFAIMLAALREIEEQRPRLEQMEKEYQSGMTENRLAQSVLDALDKVKHLTKTAQGESGKS